MEYVFFAGANGSGKSTLIKNLRSLDEYQGFKYICADDLEEELQDIADKKERMSKARNAALLLREDLLQNGKDMIYESVASHPSHLEDLDRIKDMGYKITTVYVTTESPEINLARIANRGRDNDSYLTPERVRRRYDRSLYLLSEFIKRSDMALAYDNSINYLAVFYKTPEGKNYLIGEKEWANRYIVEKLQKEGIDVYTAKDIDIETYVKLLNYANRLIVPTRQNELAKQAEQVGQVKSEKSKIKLTPRDEEVLARIRRSKEGVNFDRVYNGEIKGENADVQLMFALAFFTKSDRSQMERIYKSSALYDPSKSDGYIKKSISVAINNLNKKHHHKNPVQKTETKGNK